MDTLKPGHYWKTPFYWESGCPLPPAAHKLSFESASDEALRPLIASVMATSMDESDRFNVPRVGIEASVQELYDVLPQYFCRQTGWWRIGKDSNGRSVGFVLPVTFKEARFSKDGRPQGTIFYMGVLPEFRGHGYSPALVHEATRVFLAANCWRIFCDTGTDNALMIQAFRRAGYLEREKRQRSLAA